MSYTKKSWSFLFVLAFITLFTSHNYALANPNADVETRVRASFPDMPAMVGIAKCESGFRQFNVDGTPLRGGGNKQYIGIFQIDEIIHFAKAQGMAYDIYSTDGNIAYARYLYYKSGTNPWKGCVTTHAAAPVSPTFENPAQQPSHAPAQQQSVQTGNVSGQLSSNLSFGMTNQQVLVLQQLLNKKGFTIAQSGAGSPGNETSYFGSMTREAVRKFQCSKGIVCSGSESATGYGMVGPKTRAALVQ